MFRCLLLIGGFLSYSSLFSQAQWVWLHGDSATAPKTFSFGTQGVSSPANLPRARNSAARWKDKQGNFWIFGGEAGLVVGAPGDTVTGPASDMWKYNPSINEWTWVAGSQKFYRPAVYDVKGAFSSSNTPEAHESGRACWTDQDGYFWLFTDGVMWKYDPTFGSPTYNQWAWMHGTKGASVSYGTKGVADPSNTPGVRVAVFCDWVDKAGNLWFFGGQPWGGGGVTQNDLWKYDPVTNQWTWMHGDNISYQIGVYGTKGIADPANKPGARDAYASWTDSSGKLWMYGGLRVGGAAPEHHSDMWMYDPDPSSTTYNQWTWMSGESTTNQLPVYGTQCTSEALNTPGARYGTSARWADECGNFWLFGGLGYDPSSLVTLYADLWKYDPDKNEWLWADGVTTKDYDGFYGAKGIPSASNKPAGRSGANAWLNKDGLWLFAGISNDMWRYTLSEAISPDFTFNTDCREDTKTFIADTSFNPCMNKITSYTWNFGDSYSSDNTSTDSIASHSYYEIETYPVTLTVGGCMGETKSITKPVEICEPVPCENVLIPNAFSPNNDGQNDELKLYGESIREIYWVVFNRWGEKVFETIDPKAAWDGKQGNKDVDSGVYAYYLHLVCRSKKEFSFSGNIALIR